MTNSSTNAILLQAIKAFLSHKPAFYALIRPQEVVTYHQHQHLLLPPILDFGADDGFFASQLPLKKPSIGLDLPTSQMSQAKGYQQTLIYDGKHIPLPANSVRTVISNSVLEHIAHPQRSLQEIHRVLKPGGYFIATVMTDHWEHQLVGSKILAQPYARLARQIQQHHSLYSLTEWAQTFASLFSLETITGHLSRHTAHLLELAHYFSAPSLISHRLIGKWHLSPDWHQPFQLASRLLPILAKDIHTSPNQASALSLIVRKHS